MHPYPVYGTAGCVRRFMARGVAVPSRGVQVQAWGAEFFGDLCITAQGACEQATRELALVIVFGAKPAFKHMVLAALKV